MNETTCNQTERTTDGGRTPVAGGKMPHWSPHELTKCRRDSVVRTLSMPSWTRRHVSNLRALLRRRPLLWVRGEHGRHRLQQQQRHRRHRRTAEQCPQPSVHSLHGPRAPIYDVIGIAHVGISGGSSLLPTREDTWRGAADPVQTTGRVPWDLIRTSIQLNAGGFIITYEDRSSV